MDERSRGIYSGASDAGVSGQRRGIGRRGFLIAASAGLAAGIAALAGIR